MDLLFPLVAAKSKKITQAELIGPDGKDAALRIIALMRETVDHFPPMEVVESWRNSSGQGHYDKMWQDLGDKTATTIANGAHVLAILWQSVWVHGNGDAISDSQLIGLDKDKLMALYVDPKNVPAITLDDVATYTQACY